MAKKNDFRESVLYPITAGVLHHSLVVDTTAFQLSIHVIMPCVQSHLSTIAAGHWVERNQSLVLYIAATAAHQNCLPAANP